MHELVIRGGAIVDGSGAPAYTGDVAIEEGRLSAVGGQCGPGKREIDADGLLVTPGWVDIHTHYDGQATCDPMLAPSSCQGSTTILMGNCGVGFAPARPEHHDALVELMEGVEDIPGSALNEGLHGFSRGKNTLPVNPFAGFQRVVKRRSILFDKWDGESNGPCGSEKNCKKNHWTNHLC